MAARAKGNKSTAKRSSAAERREAVRLLKVLVDREEEPGAKGYKEGVAELIEEGRRPVSGSYLEELRRRVATGTRGR